MHLCRLLFLVIILSFVTKVHAQYAPLTTQPLTNVQIGDTVALGSQQFIKLNDTGLLMMSSTFSCPHGKVIAGKHVKCFNCPADATYDSTNVTCACNDNSQEFDINTSVCRLAGLPADADTTNCSPVGFMDIWDDCSSLAEFETVCLADPRDYRTYRVRKFADGKCWMVDSLKFGGNYGDTDGCSANNGEGNFTYAWCGGSGVSGCTAGGSSDATKAQETFATGYYGHCRTINSTYNNYLYDWVAALQNTLAQYGSSTTFDGTQQGLCPTNWHLPTGGSAGEFKALADLYGTATSTFWTETSKWNGQFSGCAGFSSGGLGYQGISGYYWSSTAYSVAPWGYYLHFDTSTVNPVDSYSKHSGLAVRCIRD